MKKILVTGSTGLFGSSLILILKKYNYIVFLHSKAHAKTYMSDLSDEIKTFEILDQINPDIIINLAALTDVELCEKSINLAYSINTKIVENISNWILYRKNNSYLIQFSTDHLYDGKLLNPETNINIKNNYAFSKYAGELAAKRVKSLILRTNFFGKSESISRKSFTDWIFESLKNYEFINTYDDVFFNPLSIKELIKYVLLAIENNLFGVYNLGSRNGMSKADFTLSFASYLNLAVDKIRRVNYINTSSTVIRPLDMRMDCSKFEKDLNIKLPDLNELIEDVAKDYL